MVGKIGKAFVFGAVPAAVLNVLIAVVAAAAGVDMRVQPPEQALQALPVFAFAVATLVPSVVGALGFAVLWKLIPAKAHTVFGVLAVVMFFLSMGTIIPQPDVVTMGTKAILTLTHVVAVAGITFGVFRFARA